MTDIAPKWVAELKKGSVQMLLLAILEEAPKYGFQIIRELREATNGFFDLKEGTLYPALRRLEGMGYLEGRWDTETEGGPRKYYHMTDSGRNALKEATKIWEELVWSSKQVLKSPE